MHIKRVEEYSFSHGLHRELNTGKFLPLQPHQFGRPLTHDEMDYNMRYMEQTLGGYKIFGSNQDTSLSENDLDQSLILHRITQADDDYDRYVSGGYFSNGDFIWIPECCGDSSSGDSCDIAVTGTVSGQATSGQNDANLIVYVSGLNGQPEFTINGSPVVADSVNGPQYTFNGYGAGTYTIVVTDLGITDYPCDDTVIITVTEEVDECLGFAVSVTTQNSGGAEDPATCELTDLTFVSSVTNIPFGSLDGEVVLRVDGNWTGPLQFTFNGNVTSPNSVNGDEYTFTGLSASTYNVYVIDMAISGNTCNEFVQFEIEEDADPCDTFTVNITTQDSGSGLEPCDTFAITLDTSDTGGDNHTNTICQDFTIGLSVELGPNDAPTGNITMAVNDQNDQGDSLTWGDLTIESYVGADPFDPSTIWTNVSNSNITDAGNNTYVISNLPNGGVWIRTTESNNNCSDTERVNIPIT